MSERIVLHVDMDAFFVSVEFRRHPELVGRPVVVGGTGRRGVVAAASYEARRYGVHSAMPSVTARRRCPSAVFLPGDYETYAAAGQDVLAIFARATPLVEPLSLDEAFLDVTGSSARLGGGVAIAERIRADVATELELSCSVGVAPNKFLAKLASVEAKPIADIDGVRPGTGVFEVRPGEELEYLHALAVSRLWGVGPATLDKLRRMGVSTVGDLARLELAAVVASVGGSHGRHLIELANARDDRPVEPHRGVKSVSHEVTFADDLHELDDIHRELVRLADGVSSRLRHQQLAARTFTLKIRDGAFATHTKSVTGAGAVDDGATIVDLVAPALGEVDLAAGVRLLGLGASRFAQPAEQLRLQLDGGGGTTDPRRRAGATSAVDDIRQRFGATAIGPASSVAGGELHLVRRGAQQWGPDQHRPDDDASDDGDTPSRSR